MDASNRNACQYVFGIDMCEMRIDMDEKNRAASLCNKCLSAINRSTLIYSPMTKGTSYVCVCFQLL